MAWCLVCKIIFYPVFIFSCIFENMDLHVNPQSIYNKYNIIDPSIHKSLVITNLSYLLHIVQILIHAMITIPVSEQYLIRTQAYSFRRIFR